MALKDNQRMKKMEIIVEQGEPETIETELLILGAYEEILGKTAKKIDKELNNELSKAMDAKEFTGEFGQIKILSTAGKFKARNVLIIGLGKRENSTISTLEKAIGLGLRVARDTIGVKNFVTTIHRNTTKDNNTIQERIQAVTEGILLGSYQFLKYKTEGVEEIKKLESAKLFLQKKTEEAVAAVEKGKIIGSTANFVRDLVNEPGSELTPEKFAEIAKKEAEKNGIKITIFDKKKIEDIGLKGLLAVNKGSVNEPRFLVLEYKGNGEKSIALVGKGLTFDSGGLDLKSAEGMDTMKSDMAGGATVLGAIISAARLNLPVHVYGVIALTENMPANNAYKPGDIIKTYSGKTIEVLNTDAEGRIILADALTYTERELKPNIIIDIATLTGACVIALGSVASGMIGDKEVTEQLNEASKKSGEKIWELPLWIEYLRQVESEIADLRNIGIFPKEAGAITAAAFLKNFIEKTPWAHIDIAGTAYTKTEKELTKKGGTGWGVKLLTTFIEQWK